MIRSENHKVDQYLAIWIIRYFLILGVFELFSRGTDYLTGDAYTIGIVEISSNTPQAIWGFACLLSATIIILGMVRDCFRIQIIGCVIAGSVYFGFSAVTITRVFSIGNMADAHGVLGPILNYIGTHIYNFYIPFPVDDWRISTDYMVEASRWFVLALFIVMAQAVQKAREDKDGVSGHRPDSS